MYDGTPPTEPVDYSDPRWFKRVRRDLPAKVRLFCFHRAGGTASTFRHWPELMAPEVEPIAVQLPGRADRLREPPFESFTLLVDALVDELVPLSDRPFAFYGECMGASVAWSLTLAVRDRGLPSPLHLFVACHPAPMHHDRREQWDSSPEGLAEYLREMGGTPEEFLQDVELVERVFGPTLKADRTVLTTTPARPSVPLSVPIRAFGGADDPTVPSDRMLDWQAETSARFELELIDGGHFFDSAGELQVIRSIGDELLNRGRDRATVSRPTSRSVARSQVPERPGEPQ